MKGRKQTNHKLFPAVAVVVGLALCAAMAFSQDNATPPSAPEAVGAPSAVPRLIKFSGVVSPPNPGAEQTDGKTAPPTTLPITFSLYEAQEGGSPLWSETQSVQLDAQGRYTVLLGAESASGLPLDLFTSGKALWLGVQPGLPAAGEPSRALLVAVPYALKAADADTLGGKPASAYVTADSQPATSGTATPASTPVAVQAVNQALNASSKAQTQGPLTVGGTGTTNYIPIWTNSTTLGNSILFQTGGNVGIGDTSPAGKLDVSGNTFIRGTLQLPATGKATATQGFNSQPLDSLASAFNSSTKAAVSQHFRWQAEPVGNNTASPSGKFNLLFASGTGTPAETGLSINNKGQLTFASGQTFPGGTVTGNETVKGNLTAKQLISNVPTGTPPLQVSSTTQVANLNASELGGFTASAFAKLSGGNSFTGPNTINGLLAVAGNGTYAYVGDPGCGSGFAGIGFGGLSGCTNYSLLGDGKNTFINRPAGGTLYFREGNGSEMTIAPGGAVSIAGAPAPSSPTFAALAVTSTLDGADGLQTFGGGSDNEFATGGRGLLAKGGTENNTSTFAGDGVDAYGGTADQGGIGIYVQGGTSRAVGGADGIDAYGGNGNPSPGYSGWFQNGDVNINDNLGVGGAIYAGTKDFRIDHPLDPSNKYFYHASVESSEMMDIYTGNVTLGPSGAATVQLPDWFEALNADFRYQLTAIGAAAPNLHIAEEVANHQFSIAGGAPGMKVSWQVTGVRHDAFAQAKPLVVEVDKPANERGFYLHPELYGQPAEKQIEWGRNPRKMKHLQELREKAAQRPRLAQAGKH